MKTVYIIILKAEQDFLFKQVTFHEDARSLESLNIGYKPVKVPVSKALEFERIILTIVSGAIPFMPLILGCEL